MFPSPRRHGQSHVPFFPCRDGADGLGNIRRIARDEFRLSFHRFATDHQRIRPPELRSHLGQGRLHGISILLNRKINRRLVPKGGQIIGLPHGLVETMIGGAGRLSPRPSGLHQPGLRMIKRIHQQYLRRNVFREARSQKRIVRRIFQESPHQVRHAGNQFAVRHVNPQPIARLDNRLLLRVGHTVEHLQFERLAWQSQDVRATAMPWASERMLWLPSAGRKCS